MTSRRKRGRLPGLSVKDGYTPHPFDLEYGVRTSGLVAGRHLKSGHAHDRHATAYYGVAPSVFGRLLRRWMRTRPAAPIEEITFIDIGAGMGRAVLLASELPFRRVVGVELNPTLVRIARRNLTVWRKAGRARAAARIVRADAAAFSIPSGPVVLFLVNPFGATVMRRLLAGLARDIAGGRGTVNLLYVNNEQEGVLEGFRNRHRGLVRLFLGRVYRSREDARADHRILGSQPEGEYASSDFEDCSIWRWTRDGGE